MRYWINEILRSPIEEGELLDPGFVLDTDARVVEWTEPIEHGETYVFTVEKCFYENGLPVSLEDGELIGMPEEDYFRQFR